VIYVFIFTLFLSSSLLFMVQPMFAKMALPMLGGSPGVWNLCMLFFQATLLAGYGYAHLTSRWLGVKKQAMLHLGVMVVPMLMLPMAIPEGWVAPRESDPTLWLLALLGVVVGLPFFAVSTMGPLMQKWFASTGHPHADDPYFLYAASNLGSMLALLAYPVLLEPLFRLSGQSNLWAAGYVGLVVMTGTCAMFVLRTASDQEQVDAAPVEPLTWKRRLRWTALAFVPSSLMLAVTTYFTSDIASVPLLWIIPLALYLLTFILVFAQTKILKHKWMIYSLPTLMLVLVLLLIIGANNPVWLIAPWHILTFFVVTMVCHGELAEDRPETAHLTEFYLIMSFGGVLGGLFNALVAPLAFDSAAEYPITLVLAALLLPARNEDGEWKTDLAPPAIVGIIAVGCSLVPRFVDIPLPAMESLIAGGIPIALCLTLVERPIRFGLGLAAIFGAATLNPIYEGSLLFAERSFFGIHRVTHWQDKGLNALMHGTTLHGLQFVEDGKPVRSEVPMTYYHRTGPAGQVLQTLPKSRQMSLGMIGLGTGSLVSYADKGQKITYYEIDPMVTWIADESPYFSYMRDARARGVELEVIHGDARLTLAEADEIYDVLVIDAFSSDSVPVHLLTVEAFRDVYLPKVDAEGFMLMNVSSRYLDLLPVLANLATELDLVLYEQEDEVMTPELRAEGKELARWVIMGRERAHLEPMVSDERWIVHDGPEPGPLWTDDFSNIMSVLRALRG